MKLRISKSSWRDFGARSAMGSPDAEDGRSQLLIADHLRLEPHSDGNLRQSRTTDSDASLVLDHNTTPCLHGGPRYCDQQSIDASPTLDRVDAAMHSEVTSLRGDGDNLVGLAPLAIEDHHDRLTD